MHLPLSRTSAGVESSIVFCVLLALVADLVDAEVAGEGAQLAVGAAGAGLAVAVVLRQEQLDDGLAALAGLGRVGLHDHAVGHRRGARGDERAGALDLDQADPAGADRLDVFEVAQARHLRAGLPGGLQDGGAVWDLDLDVVYGEGWHQRFTSVSAQDFP